MDVVLVGDSGAMTVLGYPSTVPVGVDEMPCSPPRPAAGSSTPLLVGDRPFGSYEASTWAVHTAQRFVKGRRAATPSSSSAAALRERAARHRGGRHPRHAGHVGLTPQTATACSGYRSQGPDLADGALEVVEEALALESTRCFALGLRAVPSELTTPRCPTSCVPGSSWIGPGPATDGQVLVFHDLLPGIHDGHAARFTCSATPTSGRPGVEAGVRPFPADEVRGPAATRRPSTGHDGAGRGRRGCARPLPRRPRRGDPRVRRGPLPGAAPLHQLEPCSRACSGG